VEHAGFSCHPQPTLLLTKEEQETMLQRRQRNMIYRGDDESKGKWMRLAFKDPFIYLAGGLHLLRCHYKFLNLSANDYQRSRVQVAPGQLPHDSCLCSRRHFTNHCGLCFRQNAATRIVARTINYPSHCRILDLHRHVECCWRLYRNVHSCLW